MCKVPLFYLALQPQVDWTASSWRRGGTRYGCDIWSGGTDYSVLDSRGGTLL